MTPSIITREHPKNQYFQKTLIGLISPTVLRYLRFASACKRNHPGKVKIYRRYDRTYSSHPPIRFRNHRSRTASRRPKSVHCLQWCPYRICCFWEVCKKPFCSRFCTVPTICYFYYWWTTRENLESQLPRDKSSKCKKQHKNFENLDRLDNVSNARVLHHLRLYRGFWNNQNSYSLPCFPCLPANYAQTVISGNKMVIGSTSQ